MTMAQLTGLVMSSAAYSKRRFSAVGIFTFASIVFAMPMCAQQPADGTASLVVPTIPDTARPEPPSTKILQWGLEQRTRWENWDHIIDFNNASTDERNQIRFRNRFWVNVPVQSSIDLFVGLGNEFKKVSTPDVPLNGNELIFESLYLDFKRVFVPRLSVRIGRQDLFRGEGFLLADGTSGDGSRTGYFNAVDAAYQFRRSKLELIGILDPKQDRFLPRVNDQHTRLTEWDEEAIAVYYTDKNIKSTDVEACYFYKKEINDFRAPTNPQFRPNRSLNTVGGRVIHRFSESLSATGEFASQWGRQHPDADWRAWGGYATLKETFATPFHPYMMAGYWAMSGDNPRTPNTVGGWDPLFSRWPKWGGDLLLYSYIAENGVGYASNDRFSQLEAGLSPLKRVNLRGTWYHHDAFYPMAPGGGVFGNGTYRGELLQVRTDIVLNSSIKGHVLYERFLPGDFYRENPPGHFFRMEIIYSFKAALPLRRVLREKIVAVIPANHPLAKHKRVPVRLLAALPFLEVARTTAPALHDIAKGIAANAGVAFNSILPGENVLMSLSEVASGLGFCLLPDNVRQILPPNVVARPLDCDPEPEFPLLVAYRKNDRLPAVAFFVALLREQLSHEAPAAAAAKERS